MRDTTFHYMRACLFVPLTLKNTTGSIEGRPTLAELSRTRLAYKREVKRSLHVPIAVIGGDSRFSGNLDEWGEGSLFASHHDGTLSCSSMPGSNRVFRSLDDSG